MWSCIFYLVSEIIDSFNYDYKFGDVWIGWVGECGIWKVGKDGFGSGWFGLWGLDFYWDGVGNFFYLEWSVRRDFAVKKVLMD